MTQTSVLLSKVKSVKKLFLSTKMGVAYLDGGSFYQTEMKPTACYIQNVDLMFKIVGSTLATFQKMLTYGCSCILEWFVSSCTFDHVVVTENWYGIELAIWVHDA